MKSLKTLAMVTVLGLGLAMGAGCAKKNVEEVREAIGADSLAFLSEGALLEAGNRKELCLACFNGNYPTYLYQSFEEANKDGKF